MAQSQQDENDRTSSSDTGSWRQFALYFVYGLVLVGVWTVLSLPTVIFVLPTETECRQKVLPPAIESESYCEPLNTTSLCYDFVASRSSNMVWIRQNKSQKTIEAELQAVMQLLFQFGTPRCLKHGNPKEMMCQLAFPACVEDSKGVEYPAEMCPSLCHFATTKYCVFELQAAKSAVYMDPETFGMFDIPDCGTLPIENDIIYSCGAYRRNTSSMIEEPGTSTTGPVMCPAPLIPSASAHISCSPECGTWSWTSLSSSDAIEICTWVGFIVGLLAAGVVFFTWASCSSMWAFPDIIVLYINICGLIACLLIGVGLSMGKKMAYCSANDWATAFEQPTRFCAAQGAIYHYVTVALYIWWMFLLLNKTLTILCDTSAIFMKEHSLAIHIIESVISWCTPAVLVIVVFWSGGKTYGLQSTDPLACGPVDLEVAYYTLSLPMQIVFGIALTAVILFHAVKDCKPTLIVWSGQEVRRVVPKPVGRLEKRYLILITAYPLMCLLVFLPGIPMMMNAKKLECSLVDYFVCMTLPDPKPTCEPNFKEYIYPELWCIAALSTGISCYALVFFASLSKEARACWRGHKDSFLLFIGLLQQKFLHVPCDPCENCDPTRLKNGTQAASTEIEDLSDNIGRRYATAGDWQPQSTAM